MDEQTSLLLKMAGAGLSRPCFLNPPCPHEETPALPASIPRLESKQDRDGSTVFFLGGIRPVYRLFVTRSHLLNVGLVRSERTEFFSDRRTASPAPSAPPF